MKSLTCCILIGKVYCGRPAVKWDDLGRGYCESHKGMTTSTRKELRNKLERTHSGYIGARARYYKKKDKNCG